MSSYDFDGREINKEDFDDLLRCLDLIMGHMVIPKDLNKAGRKKDCEKMKEDMKKLNEAWREYKTSVIANGFPNIELSNLSPKGQEDYKKLSKIGDKKGDNLKKLEDTLTGSSRILGIKVHSHHLPVTELIVRKEANNKFILRAVKSDVYVGSTSVKSSFMDNYSGNLLNKFDSLRVPKIDLENGEKTPEKEKQERMFYQSDLSNSIKEERVYKQSYQKQLTELSKEYSSKCYELKQARTALKYIEKYNHKAHFTLEGGTLLSSLYNEISKRIGEIKNELNDLEKEYNTKVDELQKMSCSKYEADKVSTLLHILRTRIDTNGKELSDAKYKEIQEILENIRETKPAEYESGHQKYEKEKEQINKKTDEWVDKDSERILEDEELTAEELGNRNRCYQLYVVRKNYEDVVTKSMFKYLYDKYLKLGVNGEYVIEKIVEYYVESVEYFEEMQRINKESEYKDFDDYIDAKLIEDKIIGKAR